MDRIDEVESFKLTGSFVTETDEDKLYNSHHYYTMIHKSKDFARGRFAHLLVKKEMMTCAYPTKYIMVVVSQQREFLDKIHGENVS